MTISEQIKALQAQIAEKTSARNALVIEKGANITDEDVGKANTIAKDIASLEAKLAVLVETERSIAAQAVAVPANAVGVTVPTGARLEVKSNAPKGSAIARVAMLLAKSQGNLLVADQMAQTHYADDHMVKGIIKSAVSAGTTQVAEWAGNLIYPEQYAADFIELLYPQTVLGRLTLRKAPFNVRISGMTGGTQVGWVGEAKPIPVTGAKFNAVKLGWNKVYAISAFSEELIKFSNPAAEALVLDNLVEATAQGLDVSFLSSAAATDHSPAGVLNGVAGVAASGADALHLIADIQTAVAPFIAANMNVNGLRILMSPSRALAISSMRNALGAKYFPDMSANGGTLENFTVLTSNNIANDVIVFVLPNEIYLSEDAGPQVDYSREASLIMDNDPANATSAPVSMFQTGQVAVKIGQFINWQPRRSLVANVITGAAYK